MNNDIVDAQILKLCRQPQEFSEISIDLGDIDPVILMTILERLLGEKMLNRQGKVWLRNEEEGSIYSSEMALTKYLSSTTNSNSFELFDRPHPLDYEWRNSKESLNYLLSELDRENKPNEKVLLLGFPTLFSAARAKAIPQDVTLVERNQTVVSKLHKTAGDHEKYCVIDQDIFFLDPSQLGRFNSVILDPPWYSPYFYQFMWLAAQCVEHGGMVGISLPPIETRPNIKKERVEWFGFCQDQGLSLEALHANTLSYEMPFFEYNALQSDGAQNMQALWRTGDYGVFRKNTCEVSQDRPILEQAQSKWIEREINSVRVRVNVEDSIRITDEELYIVDLVVGGILTTVSSRDERRKEANVWTSGNRIYRVNNPKLFLDLLDSVGDIDASSENSKMMSSFLEQAIHPEKSEYSNYLKWIFDALEK